MTKDLNLLKFVRLPPPILKVERARIYDENDLDIIFVIKEWGYTKGRYFQV